MLRIKRITNKESNMLIEKISQFYNKPYEQFPLNKIFKNIMAIPAASFHACSHENKIRKDDR
jgi:hypothetical protein